MDNSSNTTHLAELASKKYNIFHHSSEKIFLNNSIKHFDIHTKQERITHILLKKNAK